jgi:dienelactone hydrolase
MALKTQTLTYRHGPTALEGYLAYDDARPGPRPAVLIAPEWYGHNDYVRSRAEQIAGLGYVGFAVDMYGKGVLAKDDAEAGKLATPLFNDRDLVRDRIKAALDTVRLQPMVDGLRVAAMGYCLGGLVVLELARSGADVKGVASFHGILATPKPALGAVPAKVLVFHGHDDPFVPPQQVAEFQAEMTRANIDWQVITYGGTAHNFTVATAHSPATGQVYNRQADARSFATLKLFLTEWFGD